MKTLSVFCGSVFLRLLVTRILIDGSQRHWIIFLCIECQWRTSSRHLDCVMCVQCTSNFCTLFCTKHDQIPLNLQSSEIVNKLPKIPFPSSFLYHFAQLEFIRIGNFLFSSVQYFSAQLFTHTLQASISFNSYIIAFHLSLLNFYRFSLVFTVTIMQQQNFIYFFSFLMGAFSLF